MPTATAISENLRTAVSEALDLPIQENTTEVDIIDLLRQPGVDQVMAAANLAGYLEDDTAHPAHRYALAKFLLGHSELGVAYKPLRTASKFVTYLAAMAAKAVWGASEPATLTNSLNMGDPAELRSWIAYVMMRDSERLRTHRPDLAGALERAQSFLSDKYED